MADSGILKLYLWLPNRGNTHMFVLYKTPSIIQDNTRSAQQLVKSARHGQNQKKGKIRTELNIFLSNIFSKENKNITKCASRID